MKSDGTAITGVICLSFSIFIFIYFTIWLLLPLLVSDANFVHAFYPSRLWLWVLPWTGLMGLVGVIGAFLWWSSFIERRKKTKQKKM